MALKACIFDFDGTLGDSMWVWESVIAEFFAARGVDPEHDAMAQLAQLGMVAGAQCFVQHYRLNESPEQVCACWLAAAREKYATAVKLKPGARAFLLLLRQHGVKTAVATAQERQTLLLALEHEEALPLLDEVLTCDEVCQSGKSTPAVYWETARRLGAEPSDCLVFEDVAGPAAQAHAGGFGVVGVRDASPAQDHEALATEADAMIEDYRELLGPDALARLEALLPVVAC